MTAEILIMNKSAVAMAADSAVSVSSPSGMKIYNSANKLFMLTKNEPVGVMIYGAAQYLGMPWETIIKDFRNSPEAISYDHLQDYAKAFIRFIQSANYLFEPVGSDETVENYVVDFFQNVIRPKIDEAVNEHIRCKGALNDMQAKRISRRVIQDEFDAFGKTNLLHDVELDDMGRFIREWQLPITRAINNVFQLLPLSSASRSLLKKLAASLLLREGAWPEYGVMGLIVAGFGTKDYYPQSFHFAPRARIDGRLYYTRPGMNEITNSQLAVVQAFAQHEMVSTFLQGIDPRFKQAVSAWVQKVMLGLANAAPAVRGVIPTVLQDFEQHLQALSEKNFQDDVLGTVAILPKDELAAMAESLVNLTSFKRRVTMAPESVGGPIDVAVISKGDGFIWIKRKHYFSPEFNRHFIARCS